MEKEIGGGDFDSRAALEFRERVNRQKLIIDQGHEYIHTHRIHTYIHIYMYSYRHREQEREREIILQDPVTGKQSAHVHLSYLLSDGLQEYHGMYTWNLGG
jgi:hypothetical protein